MVKIPRNKQILVNESHVILKYIQEFCKAQTQFITTIKIWIKHAICGKW